MESPTEYRLDFIEPVAGLFHMDMAILELLLQTHMPCTLQFWMERLNRDSNIFQNRVVRKFRPCQRFFFHIWDAYVLAAVATELGARSCGELCATLEQENWRQTILAIEEKYSAPTLVANWREEEERDIVHENAVLLLQHGSMYRDFCEAIKSADTGRVNHCLNFFAIWFQGSRKSKYALETMHLVACLNHLWDPKAVQYYMDSCLVNRSGTRHGWIACDMLTEHIVKEIKGLMHHNRSPAAKLYLENVLAKQVLILGEIRDNMMKASGGTNYYKHSSTVKAWRDVQTVADALITQRVFSRTLGRTMPQDVKPAPDLHETGTSLLVSGKRIRKYIANMTKGMYSTEYEDEGDSEDDSDQSEVDSEHGMDSDVESSDSEWEI